jgi:hypothetical protein
LRLQLQLFLSRVFNVASVSAMYSQILASIYHKDNQLSDIAIYQHLITKCQHQGPLQAAVSQWKQICQLRQQKIEFRDEVTRILGRLGVLGLVKDYVAIGDGGRMVLELNVSCGICGSVWTADADDAPELTIEAAVNRYSMR